MLSSNTLTTIKTEKIFREGELDKGFILRANDTVARTIREMIHKSTAQDNEGKNLEMFCIIQEKRCYGVLLDDKLYLATLVDLPCIIEAQKTLDFRTFFKSTDVSQLLYVHNRTLDNFKTLTLDEVREFALNFNPFYATGDDPEFYQQLYRRHEIGKKAEEIKVSKDWSGFAEMLKHRHGLAPPTKNIRNIRFKKEVNEDPKEVHAVETILKDIIEYGFADNVEEELLEFDDKGELIRCIQGAKDKKPAELNQGGMIGFVASTGGDQTSIVSESIRNGERRKRKGKKSSGFEQSSMYSQSVPPNPDYDEDEEDEDDDDEEEDDEDMDDQNDENLFLGGDKESTVINEPVGPIFSIPLPQPDQQYQEQQQQDQPTPSFTHTQAPPLPLQSPIRLFEHINQQPMEQQPQPLITQVGDANYISPQIIYTADDYHLMKDQIKALKSQIKQVRSQLSQAIEQQDELNRDKLHVQHQELLRQKDYYKQEKKVAKSHIRQQRAMMREHMSQQVQNQGDTEMQQ